MWYNYYWKQFIENILKNMSVMPTSKMIQKINIYMNEWSTLCSMVYTKFLIYLFDMRLLYVRNKWSANFITYCVDLTIVYLETFFKINFTRFFLLLKLHTLMFMSMKISHNTLHTFLKKNILQIYFFFLSIGMGFFWRNNHTNIIHIYQTMSTINDKNTCRAWWLKIINDIVIIKMNLWNI